MSLYQHVSEQVARVNLRPTEGQKKAGNYAKGHIVIHGLRISIENPKGSWRSGTSLDGKTWRAKLPFHYGYIKRTTGADGDHVDVFVGPHLKSPHVFAIDQHRLHDRGFDEHKIMLGFASKTQARKAYIAAFSDGKGAKRIGHIEHMSIDAFKVWLRDGNTKRPIKRADGGRIMLAPQDAYSTPLSLHDEAAYQLWKIQNAPQDSGDDYDLRGAYLANMQRDPDNGHMGDRFKKPNHPTFSDQSQYAVGDQRERAGHWVGPEGPDQTFVPPVATRADGGKVLSDDEVFGSKPMTDDEVFGKAPPPDAGKLDAALRGVRAGATFNFGDEIEGARAAAPSWVPDLLPVGPVTLPARAMVGAARAGYDYFNPPARKLSDLVTGETPQGEALTAYQKGRDEARKNDEAARANHPYIYAGSELAGAVPAMAALPELGAARGMAPAARGIARFGARTLDAAVTGGEFGALSGAGEGKDTADRAVNAATGLVSGILGGAGGNAVGEGLGWAASTYGKPIAQTVHGWIDPKGEPSRRLGVALQRDQEMIANGTADGLTWQQWVAARQRGEPVTLADLGAGNTQALLRSAFNTSPEAAATLRKTVDDRFKDQSQRIGNTIRNALPGGEANASKTGDQLVAEYDAGRVPAYQRAYQQGDRPLMSPTMERLMGTDTFVGAMKRAISSGKDRDAVMGFGGFNPMVNVTPDGRIVFNKGAQGIPTYPNLQYWDQVKRELDSVAKQAQRTGAYSDAGQMAKILRGELDKQVPAYAKARGIAEDYFGSSNALELGQSMAGKKMDPETVRRALAKMQPDEQSLFKEGYASDLANRIVNSLSDTTNLTAGRGILQSPNERKVARMIFGPGGYAQLEARMYLETIMDGARKAMGNSTTAQQLIAAGLAGGAASGFSSGWDPTQTGLGIAGGGLGRGAAGLLIKDEIRTGAKHLIGKVDAKMALRVAQMLTSDDPRILRQGYAMAAKNDRIMQGLRNIAQKVVLTGQTAGSRPAAQGLKAISGMGARADEGDDRGRLYVSPYRGQQP